MDLGGHQRGRDRVDAAAQSLARGEQVGLEAFLEEVPHGAGASETGLHLVEHEARAAIATDALDRRQVAGVGNRHAERGRDRLEDHGGGGLVDGSVERADVVEGNLHEPGKVGPEGIPILGVAGGEREPGMAVVAAHHRDHPGAPGMGPSDLERQVVRLAATDAEHHSREQTPGRGGQALGERGPPTGHQMMVPDVERIERVAQRADHVGMTVSEVEHAAVAVTVEQPAPVERVTEARTLALPHHEIEPERLERGHLPAIHVCAERGRSRGGRTRTAGRPS